MSTTIPVEYPSSQGGFIAPAGYSVTANIAQAQQYFATHSLAASYQWFYEQVKYGGPWDYKTQGPYEGLGNFNYGAVATAVGIPEDVFRRAAGWAGARAGNGNPDWGNWYGEYPYGDDPLDQEAIGKGSSWAKENIPCLPENLPNLGLRFTDVFPAFSPRGLIDPRCNIQFQSSRSFIQRRDPLTLDLDNDGLETVGINPTAPILFDHNGDGVRTATGWVNSDDAFLVYDRNGNGTIDSGKELFGDSTQLYAGGLAADGFAALAQEDTNHDGLVNAADANWSRLKLWRDLRN